MDSTIGKSYKLIIPRSVSEEISLKPDDEVKFELQGRLVYITRANSAPRERKRQSGAAWAQAVQKLRDRADE